MSEDAALALLHLLAHSLYKAHAFLTAGEAVRDALARQMMGWTNARAQMPVWSPALALSLSAAINAGLAAGWQWAADLPSPPWIATALASVGLATLLWPPGGTSKPNTRSALMLLAGAHVYLGWHWFAQATGHLSSANTPPLLAVSGHKQVLLYNSDSLDLVGVLPFPEGTPNVLKESHTILRSSGRSLPPAYHCRGI